MTEPRTDDLTHLELKDFRGKPTVRLAEHPVPVSPVAAVDVHNHLGRWQRSDWVIPDVSALLDLMDQVNVSTIVNLDGGAGPELEANLERYDRAHPGRFVSFCRFDWSSCTEPGWPQRFADLVTDSAQRGASGIKLWKDLGLRVRDERGELVFLNDPRMEPFWDAVEASAMTVLVHTADPVAFFQPLDAENERVEELLAHPDWHFPAPEFPPMRRVLDALEAVVAARPGITFIGAHVGCYAEDLDWVDRMLTGYPNFNIDIAARLAELGRQPRRTRALMVRHPSRVLLGTDVFPPTAAAYATYFRFLATEDEHFPYSEEEFDESGRWRISGLGLDVATYAAVVSANARRLLHL